MTVVSRYNSKQLYFPEILVEKLNTIKSEALTIVEAPLGYGKTTAIRHFMDDSDLKYIWIDISKRESNYFYDKFCSGIGILDGGLADQLKTQGCPVDDHTCNKVVGILKNIDINDKAVIVLDNFQNMSDAVIAKMIIETSQIYNTKIHFVIITQMLNNIMLSELVYGNSVNYISKKDFEFSIDEVKKYYRKCGIRLEEHEAEYLQKYTDGWISAIYLQMLYYIENQEFEPDIGINHLIGEMFWDKLNIVEQDLLLNLGQFDSFTLRQAVIMSTNKISEEKIKKILNMNKFIYYDKSQRKYYIHGLLKYFLNDEFDNMELFFKNSVYEKAGKWYEGNEQYFKAIQFYYKTRNYDSIYALDIKMNDLEKYLVIDNKDLFIDIVKNSSDRIKKSHLKTAIVFCMILFIYHEMDFYNEELSFLVSSINEKHSMDDRILNQINAELMLLMAVGKYNNIDDMKKYLTASAEYARSPIDLTTTGYSWTFRTPSVLFNMYTTKNNAMELLDKFEDTIRIYYRITGGNGKGAEALMKAEILLNQGDFEGAEVLCHKALYMSETREQFCVYVGAMFCMARISVYKGDVDNLKYLSRAIDKKIHESDKYQETMTVDMARSYINILLGKVNDINAWLKSNYQIEKMCIINNIGFANLIYGRYLIEKGEYKKFSGISGQMLGVSDIYDNALYKIYLYQYVAIANYHLNHVERAEYFFMEALELARKDQFVVPFIENYSRVKMLFDECTLENDSFIKKIEEAVKNSRMKFCINNNERYGMTPREYEIAKLAAERYSNKDIAFKLHIAENTVKSNMKNIFSKLEISSRSELTEFF